MIFTILIPKKILTFFLLSFSMILFCQELYVENSQLIYLDKGNKQIISSLQNDLIFLGYSIIDSTKFFVAQEELGDDAPCSLNIYFISGKNKKILQLPYSGESYFYYCPENDHVTFQWEKGIYLLKIHNSKGEIIYNRSIKDLTLLIENNHVYEPYWLDKNRIGYKELIDNKLVDKIYMLSSFGNDK